MSIELPDTPATYAFLELLWAETLRQSALPKPAAAPRAVPAWD